jgi:tetratricopeptide (TPR) repeat protein
MGYLAFAFDLLAADAVEHARFDEAAEWRRREARRATSEGDSARGLLGLFALHGDFGPLSGFDEDLQTFEDDLGRAELLYAMAHFQDRAGQSILAIGLRQAATCANFVSPEAHATTGSWLAERGWTSDATREFYAAMNTGHANAPPAKAMIDSACMYQLAQLAAEVGDDALAAERFAATQDLVDKQQQPEQRFVPLSSTIHRHRLRLAKRDNDEAAAKKELDAILSQPQADPDASIDAIWLLREQGHDEEAAKEFERAYAVQKMRLAADPDSAQEMNNLAWLCARCREHAPEALVLSARAARLAPENAGYWDTAAEAQFAAGNCAEAVRFEKRALGLKPNDAFMTRQIARFKQGADK